MLGSGSVEQGSGERILGSRPRTEDAFSPPIVVQGSFSFPMTGEGFVLCNWVDRCTDGKHECILKSLPNNVVGEITHHASDEDLVHFIRCMLLCSVHRNELCIAMSCSHTIVFCYSVFAHAHTRMSMTFYPWHFFSSLTRTTHTC